MRQYIFTKHIRIHRYRFLRACSVSHIISLEPDPSGKIIRRQIRLCSPDRSFQDTVSSLFSDSSPCSSSQSNLFMTPSVINRIIRFTHSGSVTKSHKVFHAAQFYKLVREKESSQCHHFMGLSSQYVLNVILLSLPRRKLFLSIGQRWKMQLFKIIFITSIKPPKYMIRPAPSIRIFTTVIDPESIVRPIPWYVKKSFVMTVSSPDHLRRIYLFLSRFSRSLPPVCKQRMTSSVIISFHPFSGSTKTGVLLLGQRFSVHSSF